MCTNQREIVFKIFLFSVNALSKFKGGEKNGTKIFGKCMEFD